MFETGLSFFVEGSESPFDRVRKFLTQHDN